MIFFKNGWRYELNVNINSPIEDYDFTVTSITPDGEHAPYPDLLTNDQLCDEFEKAMESGDFL